MSEWKEYKISDLINQKALVIGDGYRAKNSELSATMDDGLPFARVGNINGGFDFDDADFFPIENLKRIGEKISKVGDTVFTSKGTVGRFAYVNEKSHQFVYSPQLCFWRSLNTKFISPLFLFYWMQSREFFEQANAVKGQTDMADYVNLADQKQMKITLPEIYEQLIIAESLSSLDDKIDLLHRQNKTLEQLAETLFRQWFVEEAKDDWSFFKLGALGKIICGKTPSKTRSEFFNGAIPFIKIPDMHGNTFVFNSMDTLTELGLNSQSKKTLPPKSICVSCIATVGLVVMNATIAQTNQQINSIVPAKEIYRYFLYVKLLSMKDELLAMASGGTATDNLNTGDFSNIEIAMPDERLLRQFDDQVKLMFNKIFVNQIQVKTLTQLRDTLLPKLMSGEVRINPN